MSHPLLSIIIVSYNTKELLKQCVNSIIKSLANSPINELKNIEIIIVDNHSTDRTREYLLIFKRSHLGKLKTIFNKENLGFAKANNQGIKVAEGKYILLLNSDTKIVPGALEKMISFAQKRKDAGIVAPKLLNKGGKTSQASCYKLPTIRGAINEYWFGKKGSYEKYLPRGGNPVKVEAAIGAAMLIPKAVVDVVGLLDEKYFMYFEDLDYCRRVNKSGFMVYYLPQARIIHYGGQSGKKKPNKVNHYLTESSKKFNGFLKYNLIFIIIKLSRLKKIPFLFLMMLTALLTVICLLLWLLVLKRN